MNASLCNNEIDPNQTVEADRMSRVGREAQAKPDYSAELNVAAAAKVKV